MCVICFSHYTLHVRSLFEKLRRSIVQRVNFTSMVRAIQIVDLRSEGLQGEGSELSANQRLGPSSLPSPCRPSVSD